MATDAEIIKAARAARGNRRAAARRLDVDPETVRRRILKLGTDLCPSPWHGGSEPAESATGPRLSKRIHGMDECVQDVPIDHLVVGIHDLIEARMDPETICRRFVALLATIVGEQSKPHDRWTKERLAEEQEKLYKAFLKW